MPTYEYSCATCNEVIEVYQSMRDDALKNCPKCGQPGVKRLLGRGAGIIFKGSGFYETDYRRTSAKKEGGESSGGASTAPAAAPAAPGSGSSSSSATPAPKPGS